MDLDREWLQGLEKAGLGNSELARQLRVELETGSIREEPKLLAQFGGPGPSSRSSRGSSRKK